MAHFGFQWHLTDHCNLRCRHCYQDDFSGARAQPIDRLIEMADRIVAGLPDRSIEVNLTGGEPLLFDGLLPLVEQLHSFPNLAACHLITNGTVVRAPIIEALHRLPKLKYIKISLEAATPDINDRIRGRGNLRLVTRHIAELKARTGKPIVLMNTLAKYNVHAIPALVRLAEEVGAAGVIFERFVPLGRGSTLADQTLEAGDWETARQSIIRAAGIDADPADLQPFQAFWLWTDPTREDRLQGARCNLGPGSMALMPDGAVFPCRRLPIPVGHLPGTPFSDILDRLAEFEPAGCRALDRAVNNDLHV
jgi:MoaA/NifB/PqqE/SkfB family radical SAM enzyme